MKTEIDKELAALKAASDKAAKAFYAAQDMRRAACNAEIAAYQEHVAARNAFEIAWIERGYAGIPDDVWKNTLDFLGIEEVKK